MPKASNEPAPEEVQPEVAEETGARKVRIKDMKDGSFAPFVVTVNGLAVARFASEEEARINAPRF